MEVQLGATGVQPGITIVNFIGFRYFSSFNILIRFPSGVRHYAGLSVHREFVIHVLFGRTEISYL